jgi:hypothetical protein
MPTSQSSSAISAAAGGKSMSVAQFFKRANPASEVSRVLAAGYFLEKNRNQENFTAAEIRDLIQEARRPAPKNVSDAINQNIKKGVMMAAGDRDNKMAFVLTSDGEDVINQMLSQS